MKSGPAFLKAFCWLFENHFWTIGAYIYAHIMGSSSCVKRRVITFIRHVAGCIDNNAGIAIAESMGAACYDFNLAEENRE